MSGPILLLGDVEVARAKDIEEALAQIAAREFTAAIVEDLEAAERLRGTPRGAALTIVVAAAGDAEAKHQGGLMSVLAHDLRSPLSAITTGVELLRLKAADTDLVRPIERIASATRRLTGLIDHLSDLARVRAGTLDPPSSEAADLAALAREAAGAIKTERGLDVAANGDAGGRWDAPRVVRALKGILEDAARRGDPATPVRVIVDGSAARDVRLVIRGGSAPPASELALYLARRVMLAHGGSLEVAPDDAGGRGAIVTIVLPRHAHP